MNKHKNNPVRQAILKKIEAGNVSMKPKWHFLLGSILLVVGVGLTIAVVVYLTSLFVFTLSESGLIHAPRAGSRGILEFLRSMPWVLVSGAIVFLVVLEILVRKYRFAYQKPLLYSGVLVIGIGIVGGIAAAPAHRPLHEAALKGQLPLVGGVYRDFGPDGYHRITKCKIVKLQIPDIIAEGPRKEAIIIHTNTDTRLPFLERLTPGTEVLVLGPRDKGEIEAEAIRVID